MIGESLILLHNHSTGHYFIINLSAHSKSGVLQSVVPLYVSVLVLLACFYYKAILYPDLGFTDCCQVHVFHLHIALVI